MDLNDNIKVCDVDDFDIIFITTCDIHGISRGRFVFRESVPGVVKNGLGMAQAALFCGILCDLPTNLTDYRDSGWTNGTVIPDLATLKPMSWLSYGGQKVGHMLCDLYDQSRDREISSSREVALRQICALKALGYDIVTSYDLEFTLFHKGTLTPVSLHDDISKLENTLVTSLTESSFPVTSISRGTEPGQLLIYVGNQHGIAASDSLHQLHGALKSLCAREGYDISWMTKPISGVSGNRSSYITTLKTEDGRNVFTDASSQDNISVVARHWIAGLLHHNAAITALARPTLNCYSLADGNNIFQNSWTTDEQDRTCRLYIQASDSGVCIRDRISSSSSNPYNVIGALIAAGLDGVINKLELGEKGKAKNQPQSRVPASLSDALSSLEEDKVLQELIGPKFVHRFLLLKREFEVGRLENRTAENDCRDILEFERSIYLLSL